MESDQRDHRCHRPSVFDRMEKLVKDMQDVENGGVPVRSQKLFLTSIPAAFMGYDLIEWLMERLTIEESGKYEALSTTTQQQFFVQLPEALNLATQLCQHGYFFPLETKSLIVKDDSSLYRFQAPYYWPCQSRPPDNVEYATYLAKRTLRNKQRHGLEEYELEALSSLRKNLANKWDIITMQAEEQVRLAKSQKKGDKMIIDSQERAFWRVHRPPFGMTSPLEQCPVPMRSWDGSRTRRRTVEDCKLEVEILKSSLSRTRIKASQAIDSLIQYMDQTYAEYDPIITATQPSNPWVSEDTTYWQLNGPLVEIPTEKRVKKWGVSMEDLVSDPTGLMEFTNYLRKVYSHENIRFWMAVNDLRRSAHSQIQKKVNEIFEEFLAPGAPCEINIDGKTMEKVHQEMKTPSRFTFDAAQEHVYTLLLKKDCYPRFIRSDYYKNLLERGKQPLQKKRFFGFGQAKKKTSTSNAPNQQLLQQQASQGASVISGALTKRRGSDRSLSGSAHELAVSGVNKDGGSKVPHSHSQSNLSDIPYRGDMVNISKAEPVQGASSTPVKKPNIAIVAGASTSEDVCPWDTTTAGGAAAPPESRSRKNSAQLDSGSSSSDISVAVLAEAVAATTERLARMPANLTQQHTVDDSTACHKLSTGMAEAPRRASVSVPIAHCGEPSKRKVSSFEDSSASTSSSVFAVTGSESVECAAAAVVVATATPKDEVNKQQGSSACSEKQAPTISVSSAVDEPGPQAPLAQPDESPASDLPPEEEDAEAKANDVCPWEDEETCKVDTPFVKTYATLGYL